MSSLGAYFKKTRLGWALIRLIGRGHLIKICESKVKNLCFLLEPIEPNELAQIIEIILKDSDVVNVPLII